MSSSLFSSMAFLLLMCGNPLAAPISKKTHADKTRWRVIVNRTNQRRRVRRLAVSCSRFILYQSMNGIFSCQTNWDGNVHNGWLNLRRGRNNRVIEWIHNSFVTIEIQPFYVRSISLLLADLQVVACPDPKNFRSRENYTVPYPIIFKSSGVIRIGLPVWKWKHLEIFRTKVAQKDPNGPDWKALAPKPLCLIQF